jgi:macrolide transport system ATP-binding/permease protein
MKGLRAAIVRLAAMFSRRGRERAFREELESHLQMHVDDNVRAGMTPGQARRAAILKLGGVESTRQAYRERSTLSLLDHLSQDARFAIRQLAKNPGFTCTAIVMLALGTGASVAIFGFVDAALITPLPYWNPSRLVHVTERTAQIPRANLSYPDYLDWKRLNTVFRSLDVYSGRGYMLNTPLGAQLVPGARVSDGFFRTLGVTPMLGRDFQPGEDLPGAPRTVILGHAAWQTRFGANPDIVGQTITLSGMPHTIVGVLPTDFQFAPRGRAEFWTTLHAAGSCDTRRSCHNLEGIGRLEDGVSVQAALSAMSSIAQQLEKQYPDSNRDQGASVLPLSDVIVGDLRPILLTLLGGASLLLVIACVNVTSLLLVRSESRKRELSVRSALGASPGRLISQFVTEGSLLVLAGGVLGLATAEWAMRLLTRLIPPDMMANMPYLRGLGLGARTVAAAAVISSVAAVVFSIAPTLRISPSRSSEGLAEGNRWSAGTTWHRLGFKLVVLELATAVVLLVGAGLLGKSLYQLLHVDLGFQPDRLATMTVVAPPFIYTNNEQRVAAAREVVHRVKRLPGVASVGITSVLPVNGNGNTDWIRFVGRPYHGEHNEVNQRDVSADYFTTLHTRLVRGRHFTEADDASAPRVAIINQALARHYFPGEDPIGKRIGNIDLSPDSIKEIVGVVDDVREATLDTEIWPAVYYPFNQDPGPGFSLVVRTSQAEESMLPTVRAAVREVGSSLGMSSEATMQGNINESQPAYLRRSAAWLAGGFAGLALLLGVVGLYGVIAYSVSQRTRELGVRLALGAQRGSVYRLILGEAGMLAATGILLGLVCSLAAATLMRRILFETPPWHLPTLIAVAALLAVSALVASYIPARRAASVNPIEALRAE